MGEQTVTGKPWRGLGLENIEEIIQGRRDRRQSESGRAGAVRDRIRHMASDKNELCLKCDHPKSEHTTKGCTHLDDMGPQEHGNRESKICNCTGFIVSKRTR